MNRVCISLVLLTLACGGATPVAETAIANIELPRDNGIVVIEVSALRASAREHSPLILAVIDESLSESLPPDCITALDSIERIGLSLDARVVVSNNPVAIACARAWPMFRCDSSDDEDDHEDEPQTPSRSGTVKQDTRNDNATATTNADCSVNAFPWGLQLIKTPEPDELQLTPAQLHALAEQLRVGVTPPGTWLYGIASGDWIRALDTHPSVPATDEQRLLRRWVEQMRSTEFYYGSSQLRVMSDLGVDGQPTAQQLVDLVRNGVAQMEAAVQQQGTAEGGHPSMASVLRNLLAQTRFEAVGGRASVESAAGLEQLGIVLGIGLPAFTNYVRRSKASEARTNLRALQIGIDAWNEAALANARTVRGRLQLPSIPSAPLSIATPGVNRRTGDYSAPAWSLFAFEPEAETYYSYEVIVEGNVVYLRAHGNLDDDEIPSLFVIRGERDPQTGVFTWEELQVENELE